MHQSTPRFLFANPKKPAYTPSRRFVGCTKRHHWKGSCAVIDGVGEKYPPNLIWIMPAKGSYRVNVHVRCRILRTSFSWIADLQ
jgi:hypothetical protein